jgi:hypothetical protein
LLDPLIGDIVLAYFKAEPALILGLVGTAIALFTAFGLHMSPEQVGAIMAFVSAGLAVVTRSQVSPVVIPPTPTYPITEEK